MTVRAVQDLTHKVKNTTLGTFYLALTDQSINEILSSEIVDDFVDRVQAALDSTADTQFDADENITKFSKTIIKYMQATLDRSSDINLKAILGQTDEEDMDHHLAELPAYRINAGESNRIALNSIKLLWKDIEEPASFYSYRKAKHFIGEIYNDHLMGIPNAAFLVNVGEGIDMIWNRDGNLIQVHFGANYPAQPYMYVQDSNGFQVFENVRPSQVVAHVRRMHS